MISIMDYGAGNLKSVVKSFDYIGAETKVISMGSELNEAERLVLPGVGAFGAAVSNLRKRGLYYELQEFLSKGRPFLGICLGMQLLLEGSEEAPETRGFSLMKGHCRRFRKGTVAQIGWNRVQYRGRPPSLLRDVDEGACFYFIHSYYVPFIQTEGWTIATSDYYGDFVSVAEAGHLAAVQFHPEKSGEAGLRLLRNWIKP